MPEITTIDEVLAELDKIVDTTLQENSALGIFAWVYRRTTAAIAKGIRDDRFEDGARMEQFDVAFARKYINAFWRYRDGEEVAGAWQVAFEATDTTSGSSDLIIMQHLLLGMNAHINLDLGIAAAEVAPADDIDLLKKDFLAVNSVLKSLIDEIQHRITHVSPLMFLLDLIGKRDDEAVINFSINKARACAWEFALKLADAGPQEKEQIIERTDREISNLANFVAYPPGFLLDKCLSVIRFFEEKNTRTVIKKLKVEELH